MSTFFTPEVNATIVGVLLGALLSILGWLFIRWLNRKKPKTVKVIKWNEASVFEVKSEVKKDIAISFKGTPVDTLFLSEFVLKNSSDETIDDIEIDLVLSGDILEVNIENPLPKRQAIASKPESERIHVSLSYLNNQKLYHDQVKLKLFSLAPIKVVDVTGGGKEWKVEFIDRYKVLLEVITEVGNIYSSPMETLRSPWRLLKISFRAISIGIKSE